MNRRLTRLTLEISVPLALLALWWVLSEGSQSIFYPPLAAITEAFRDDWLFARVGSDLAPSLIRLGIGYGVASLLGIAAGLALGRIALLGRAFGPLLEFFRFIPPPVTAPIFIVIWGIGDLTKVFFIIFGVVWSVLMNTMDGARSVDRMQLEVAKVFHFPAWRRLLHVILPASLPRIFVGLRNGLAVGVVVMAVGEMVGSTNGIGYQVLDAQRSFEIPAMWASMFMLGIVGYLLNAAFLFIERRALFWYTGAREAAEDGGNRRANAGKTGGRSTTS
ncbi:ABC transporter permease [Streptomyces sp. TP-A0874]|uniref:ABC transporter permease n=1 Tax=Streptomyces sp. TP-A0874 TaxID=549819 RepID=UPI000852EC4F|nr:ABC transporter permease [Streptomyces sp. TP-A0874]